MSQHPPAEPRLNVILKSFHIGWGRAMLGEIFRDTGIGTCISINETATIPAFPADRHLWMSPKLLRQGRYENMRGKGIIEFTEDVMVDRHRRLAPASLPEDRYLSADWSAIAPLDEELIERMRWCEVVFLSMVERYALHGDMPYGERRRQYLKHLRFWNHTLDAEKIGLFLLFNSPHQAYDYVLYQLCKLKRIPTYNFEFCDMLNGIFVTADFERSAEQLVPANERLQREYADPSPAIPLSPAFEEFFGAATSHGAPLRTVKRDRHLDRKNFIAKWSDKALTALTRHPGAFLAAALSPRAWKRKLAQHRTTGFYDRHVREPDFTAPYVYVPLHMQPEDAAIPRGGAFGQQELMVELLAACLPPGVSLYIKEHPMQGELYRSEAFYRSMLSIPSVRFVPRSVNTFELIRHSRAVATLTGTAGFEALFFGKPTLMFGHRFYQYAPGVLRVRTAEDCREAVARIFERGETPSLRDMRLFLKAVEECSIPYRDMPHKRGAMAEDEENVRSIGRKVREIIRPALERH